MAKIIVTGHGHFATGLESTVELLAGPQADLSFVDFTGDMDDQKLHAALQKELTDAPTVFFCDLLGGTPFKQAVTLSTEVSSDVAVVAGANVAALLETAPTLASESDANALADKLVDVAKQATTHFKLKPVQQPAEDDDEDGI